MDIETAAWIVAIVGLVAFGGLSYWVIDTASRGRVMRCPETESIAFVRAVSAAGSEGKAPEVTVRQCDLWPERKDCAQGCLARYWETTPGLPVNLDALRPFEPK